MYDWVRRVPGVRAQADSKSRLPFLTCDRPAPSTRRSFPEALAQDPYCNSFEAGAQNPYWTCSVGSFPVSAGGGVDPAVEATAPASSRGSSAEHSDAKPRRLLLVGATAGCTSCAHRCCCRHDADGAPEEPTKATGRVPARHAEGEATTSHRRACSSRAEGPGLNLQGRCCGFNTISGEAGANALSRNRAAD